MSVEIRAADRLGDVIFKKIKSKIKWNITPDIL
jgi:hypothetical protein